MSIAGYFLLIAHVLTLTRCTFCGVLPNRTFKRRYSFQEVTVHASSRIAEDQKRAVLYPQGRIESESGSEHIAKLLTTIGADPMRHIDQTYSALSEAEAFKRYIKYISRFDDETLARAIVLLIKTESVPYGILKPRQILTKAVPLLVNALWCIYVDVERDPFAISNLHVVGKVYGLSGQEQIFIDYRKKRYLLLKSDCDTNSTNMLRENAERIRRTTGSFMDRENPSSRRIPNNEPPLTRDDFLGENTRPTPGGSYPAPRRRSSRPVPIVRQQGSSIDTGYRFQSEIPTRPKRKTG